MCVGESKRRRIIQSAEQDDILTLRQYAAVSSAAPGRAKGRSDLRDRTREDVVGWIIELWTQLSMRDETVHCCVSLFDRFVCAQGAACIPSTEFRAVAIACLAIAAKLHEVDPIDIRLTNWVEWERRILLQFGFNVLVPDLHTLASLHVRVVAPGSRMLAETTAVVCRAVLLNPRALEEFSLASLSQSCIATARRILTAVGHDAGETGCAVCGSGGEQCRTCSAVCSSVVPYRVWLDRIWVRKKSLMLSAADGVRRVRKIVHAWEEAFGSKNR
eukprot:TRINITY_DN17538_c0_g1_i3.p1 TRINITY_DN17538_c0_g1~~TRINITY_DN17538_c0_g1_i3.p1  ORF type:complete len:289 (+),score=14.61 TRINITY_DN17538_c0_g1_i3:51-869(+)